MVLALYPDDIGYKFFKLDIQMINKNYETNYHIYYRSFLDYCFGFHFNAMYFCRYRFKG